MTSYTNKLLVVMQLCSIVLATALIAASAQAQAPSASSGRDIFGNPGGSFAFNPRFRFSLMPWGFGRRPATGGGTAGRSRAGAIGLSRMGAGPILPVVGSGTLGRITKWTGFGGSNSLIGDTSLFEDKLGNVGIGTDAPTSRFTVAGIIETTLGGYKFPDGTIQTTALSSGDVVRSLNGLKGDVGLFGVGNITINNIPPNLLTVDVRVPLVLSGSAASLIVATNTGKGNGVSARRGDNSAGAPGSGAAARGENCNGCGTFDVPPGNGVVARGGDCNSCDSFVSGRGVVATGGQGPHSGGQGVLAIGGEDSGPGTSAGEGLFAEAGLALNGGDRGLAILTDGNVVVQGDLRVTGNKDFMIDHPLDPENKYLLHAAIESSEVLNLYTGNIILGRDGAAVVTLPTWFGALNRDFRYQLTAIGAPGQGLYIAEEINNNQFRIDGGAPGMKVSWQVTGVRSDARSLQHPFKAEQDKPERERATYLAPEAFGQPEEKGFVWSRLPDLMAERKKKHNR